MPGSSVLGKTPIHSAWVPRENYRVVATVGDHFQEYARTVVEDTTLEVIVRESSDVVRNMVLIEAGPFVGGVGGLAHQFPEETYTLPAFYIDVREVTIGEYRRFLDATGHRWPEVWNGTYPGEHADKPVACVNWYDARAYAEFAGKRLPTRLEWDRMARGRPSRKR